MKYKLGYVLTRRLQKRLHFCSHRRWDLLRDICLGCEHTGQEIMDGRA